MAMNNSEKKKIKLDAKKIGRIICFVLLTIALIVGIVFSSIKVNMDMIYGPEYNGAFQASVQVTENPEKESMDDIAESLENKLSPFSDNSVTVSKKGKSHLTVTAGKQNYKNNQTYLRDQIEANGGIFLLDPSKGYTDFSLSTDGNTRTSSKELFKGNVKATTLPDVNGRSPFIRFKLDDSSKLAGLLNPKTDNNTTASTPNIMFVSNLEEIIDTLRFLFVVDNSDAAMDVYWKQIVFPIQKIYESKDTKEDEKILLRDLFGGKVVSYVSKDSVIPHESKISLLDKNFGEDLYIKETGKTVSGINTEDDLKNLVKAFTPDTSEMPTSKFIYSANTTKFDSSDYISWMDKTKKINVKDAFAYTIDAFFKNNNGKSVLFGEEQKTFSVVPKVNSELLKIAPQLQWNILFSGEVLGTTKEATSINGLAASGKSFIVDNGSTLSTASDKIEDGFYLRTKNMTSAKRGVASVEQNASGINYLVESISDVNPYITSVLYIVSLVFLSIIALLLAAYVLYVYRFLGLFTIIIAACSAAIVLLAATGFGIAMGPQVICALFVTIALILDVSLVLFEKWKENYYKEKRGIMSSFKIGNKATLAMAIDAVLVAFIPSMVLFWATSGTLKTFGTLTIIGAGLAVVVGILIGRFIYWLILRNKWVQKTDWLLPIDTRYSSLATLKDELAINKYSNFLENHSDQTQYSTKELEAINKAKEQLEIAKKSYQKNLIENNKKVMAKDEKTLASINKNTATLTKWRAWFISKFKVKQPEKNWIVKLIDARLDDNKFIVNVDSKADSDDNEDKSKLRDKGKIVRADRTVSRGSWWLSVVLFGLLIISAIIGGVLSVSWTSGVGYGQQIVVYGQVLNSMDDKIGTTAFALNDKAVKEKWESIKNQYGNDDRDKEIRYAYEVRDFLQYLNDENKWSALVNNERIKLGKAKFKVIINYQHAGVKPGTDEQVKSDGKDMYAVIIDSPSRDKASRTQLKHLLTKMAGMSVPKDENDTAAKSKLNSNTGGILAYDLSPFTVKNDIRKLGIAFGIALAVLVIYILIRFKWTYYVALALGLGLVVGTVVALITIFQIPMSTELLCGMAFVIIFALTSMILVLGEGKSKLNLSSKEEIKKNYSEEIKVYSEIYQKRAETRSQYVPLKEKLNKIKNQINKLKFKKFFKKDFDEDSKIDELQKEYDSLKPKYKETKKTQKAIYKQFKVEGKQRADKAQRHNWYFKELFASLIKYSGWRMATLGVFYLLTGIILTVTLPTIFGMGLTIIFGIIAAFAIALFVSVPIWVYFEKRRIRYVYGRKLYIASLKVSHEEETVKGIND